MSATLREKKTLTIKTLGGTHIPPTKVFRQLSE